MSAAASGYSSVWLESSVLPVFPAPVLDVLEKKRGVGT